MEINVVDTVDVGAGVKVMMKLEDLGQKVVQIPRGDHAVPRVVDKIILAARGHSPITVLRLYAHGGPGEINVGGGEYKDPLALTLANLPKFETSLQRLSRISRRELEWNSRPAAS
ncbi:MAG: hypothetical protein C5B58_08390 [Acidobacteria bacterium]|nr:MAG: hypothetical protein C5B58_08390 [Acidobacteriota bacterium]